MTELTQDQRDTLERAQAREGKTSKKLRVGTCHSYTDNNPIPEISITILHANESDVTAVADTLALQDLALAQHDIITEQAARIAELEALVNHEHLNHLRSKSFADILLPKTSNDHD